MHIPHYQCGLLLIVLLVYDTLPSAYGAVRYSRTTESRRELRIKRKARLPVDMHLPLIPIEQQSTALIVTYIICIITLIASFALIVIFDNSLMRAIRRICCFCFCCMYGFGRFWNKRLDGDLEREDDDSADELCCFKVSESVRKRRPVTLIEFNRRKQMERFSMLESEDDQTKLSASRSKLFSEHTLSSLSSARNYKQRDAVLKIRLEFLTDLAAFMSARTMQQIVSEESSFSEEETGSAHQSQSSTDQLSDEVSGGGKQSSSSQSDS